MHKIFNAYTEANDEILVSKDITNTSSHSTLIGIFLKKKDAQKFALNEESRILRIKCGDIDG